MRNRLNGAGNYHGNAMLYQIIFEQSLEMLG